MTNPLERLNHVRGELRRTREDLRQKTQQLELALRQLAAYDEAADRALVETHRDTPTDVAELRILLEHALERHREIERERNEARGIASMLTRQIEAYLLLDAAPKPPGYAHLASSTIEAIRSTTMTHADRQNVTQDEVFAKLAAMTSAEDPPPAKDDAQ